MPHEVLERCTWYVGVYEKGLHGFKARGVAPLIQPKADRDAISQSHKRRLLYIECYQVDQKATLGNE